MLSPGDMVTPTVRLVRKIGEGGMGSVWIADHLSLRTEVAVKFMTEGLISDPGAMDRFRREATASARVKSPHIVQVFDHGLSPGGSPFIVMELLDGRDLRDHLMDRVSLEPVAVAHILTQACRGLTKAHAVGVVHRDIKPDNLFLLDPDGEPFVKILDFGVAKQQQGGDDVLRMTATGTVVGTPYYMGPEQALGVKNLDHLCDLWSLSVVAYQAIAGSLPFGGDTIGALFVAIDRGIFAPPSVLVPGLGDEIDAWFERALARDPAKRFQTAKELAESFEAAVAGHPSVRAAVTLPSSEKTTTPVAASPPLEVAAISAAGGASTLDPQTTRTTQVTRKRSARSVPVIAAIVGIVAIAFGVTMLASRRPADGPGAGGTSVPPAAASSSLPAVPDAPSPASAVVLTPSVASTGQPAISPYVEPAASSGKPATSAGATTKRPGEGKPVVAPPRPARTVDRGF